MLGTLKYRLSENGVAAEFTDAAIEKIADEGFDITYGARPLRRAIQSQIEDLVAEKMLEGDVKDGTSITVDCEDGKFVVKTAVAAESE